MMDFDQKEQYLLDKTYHDHDHVQQSLVSGAGGNNRK